MKIAVRDDLNESLEQVGVLLKQAVGVSENNLFSDMEYFFEEFFPIYWTMRWKL